MIDFYNTEQKMQFKKQRTYTAFRAALSLFLLLCVLLSAMGCTKTYQTETVKLSEKGNIKMIAHRGISGLEVENTDGAFLAAAMRSYYGIEADLKRTADGKFIICHDSNLRELAGKKISVEGSTYEELLAVNLLNKNGEEDPTLHLSTLESYIGICKAYGKQAFLEFKSNFNAEEIKEIVTIIDALGYLSHVTFLSGTYQHLLTVRELSPTQEVQYVCYRVTSEIMENLIRDKIDVDIRYTGVRKAAVEQLHAAGLKVNVWTVDSAYRISRLLSFGVDYVTTNILE